MIKKHFTKILCLALSLIMVMSMGTSVFASETDDNGSIPAVEDTAIFTSDTFFYNAETGETVAENGEPFAFDDIEFEFEESESQDGISTADVSIEIYLLRGGLKRTSNGTFTWWFNTDCPTSPINKPNIKVTAQLQGNFTTGSTFSNVGSHVYHTYNTNAEYGIDYTWTSTAKTGYYRIKFTLTDYDAGGKVQSANTNSQLWNRTGHAWTFSFSDSASGKYLPKPPANYTKGATSTRPSNLADTYYTTYTNNTGVTLNRSLYDVHHIQPLAYGGNNSYSNLIHLPKATHTSVTSWWAGY